MTPQAAVTVIAEVRPDQWAGLVDLLKQIGQDAAANDLFPFGGFPAMHFGRFIAVEEAADLDGRRLPPRLVYMADVDGTVEGHLQEMVEVAGPGLDRLFGHCVAYPAGTPTDGERLRFLRAWLHPAAATYVNTVGRTVDQIRRDAALRDAIGAFLDRDGRDWSSDPAWSVRRAILDFVEKEPSLSWAFAPDESPGLGERIRDAIDLVATPLVVLALLPLAVPSLPFYLALLRYHELHDEASVSRPDDARVRALAALEDFVAQNQFTAIGLLKRGLLRRLTAETILALANYGVRHVFNRANLTGVKTIHAARWVFMDDKRRIIFGSNYDGSLENYMGDFIDKVAWGLNAVFSNGVGYPRTNWLVLDGARDELAFKHFIRERQIPTQVWYSAYPHLTALNIENNARIREGLREDMDAVAIRRWLARL